MKKIIVLLMVAVMVIAVAPVYADETLDINGEFRLRMITMENYTDKDDSLTGDDLSYFDQRLRIGGTITPAEGLSATFRMDLGEGVWGGSKLGGLGNVNYWAGDYSNEGIEVDRAYMTWDQEMFTLNAGLLINGAGNWIIYDGNYTGFVLDIKGLPVSLQLSYGKALEGANGTGLYRTDVAGTEDADFYGATVGYAADTFAISAFYAAINDEEKTLLAGRTKAQDCPNGFGVNVTATLGMVNLNAELDFLNGDYDTGLGSTSQDYEGTQLYVDASAAVLENFTVGAEFFWAAGNDELNTVQSTTVLDNGGSFVPMDRGPQNTYIVPLVGDIFDPNAEGTGVVGFGVHLEYAMDAFTFTANGYTLSPETDENLNGVAGAAGRALWDSSDIFNLGVHYAIADNLAFFVQYNYTAYDYVNPATKDDPATALWGQFSLTF
jgi:hypothetical protein